MAVIEHQMELQSHLSQGLCKANDPPHCGWTSCIHSLQATVEHRDLKVVFLWLTIFELEHHSAAELSQWNRDFQLIIYTCVYMCVSIRAQTHEEMKDNNLLKGLELLSIGF